MYEILQYIIVDKKVKYIFILLNVSSIKIKISFKNTCRIAVKLIFIV